MRLHCLGTTGYHPSPTRHTACYYLPDLALVLDAGTAVFRLVDCLREEPHESLDILLSHAHLDHIVGLTFLLDVIGATSLKRVRLHGDPEKLAAVRDHLYHELLFPVPPEMDFIPFSSSSGEKKIGQASVSWFPLEHPGGSLGFVIRAQSKVLAYITDTVARREASYVPMIEEADLLLHECYFRDDQQEMAVTTGHSWLAEVEAVVERARPKQTLLIHINPLAETLGNPLVLSREQSAQLNMSVAEDGRIVEF